MKTKPEDQSLGELLVRGIVRSIVIRTIALGILLVIGYVAGTIIQYKDRKAQK